MLYLGFPGGARGKEPACQCREKRDVGSIPGLGRSPGKEHGNPFQQPCLDNPKDRGVWQAMVHRVAESDMTEATQHAHAVSTSHNTMLFIKNNKVITVPFDEAKTCDGSKFDRELYNIAHVLSL